MAFWGFSSRILIICRHKNDITNDQCRMHLCTQFIYTVWDSIPKETTSLVHNPRQFNSPLNCGRLHRGFLKILLSANYLNSTMSDKHQLIDLVLQINFSAVHGLDSTEIWRNSMCADKRSPLILNKLQCIKCLETINCGII